jgi:hypothetical protein
MNANDKLEEQREETCMVYFLGSIDTILAFDCSNFGESQSSKSVCGSIVRFGYKS